jgi:ATP-dependent DNA helicase RecQ
LTKCLIFDFDNTIIDTTSLLEFRKKRDWNSAIAGLSQCIEYSGIVEAMRLFQQQGVLIAIFSNSPRMYIEKAIELFNIPCDYLVAYHDVNSHKPSPDGITKIAEYFSLKHDEIFYIGDEELDFKTAQNADVAFAGVSWGSFYAINTVSLLDGEPFESISEFIQYHMSKTLLKREGIYYYIGYYQDPIKNRLLDFKSNKSIAIREWDAILTKNIESLPDIDFIVRALGHNELEAQDTEVPLDVIAKSIANQTGASYIPKLLRKRERTKKSTTMTQAERAREIDKKYFLNPELSANHLNNNSSLLIIDDVYTTGATTNEIIRAIHESIPTCKCYVLALVRTSFASSFTESKQAHNEKLLQAFIDLRVNRSKNTYFNKPYSANYIHSNHNFMIQNLYDNTRNIPSRHAQYIPGIYILKNLLQRGKPTLMSKYLQSHLGSLHTTPFFKDALPFIDCDVPVWKQTIRGDSINEHYPAKKFLENLIPKYFNEYTFIQALLIPEMHINDITQMFSKEYENQQVDFYLPQAALVIEIDGSQHSESVEKDLNRDLYLKKYGIHVIRIKVYDLNLENAVFIDKIEQIKSRISQLMGYQRQRSDTDSTFISLKLYQEAYNTAADLSDKRYVASAVMRIQLVLLELLENGVLTFDNDWNFEIKLHDVVDFIEIAIEDLFLWFHHLYKLQKITFVRPAYKIYCIEALKPFTPSNTTVKIDFSLMKRYTDEFNNNENVIFVRTHYLDEYQYFKPGNGSRLEFVAFKPYDYFKISTTIPISYKFNFGDEGSDSFSLLFILENVFLQNAPDLDFNEGQLAIIANALSGNDTIGLLPTGSGKSVCYQLSTLLQPAISFVVCPIKSLMYDQKADLDTVLFSRCNYITSDMDSFEKDTVSKEYSSGKYFFVFISPERFQIKSFRAEFAKINQDFHFAYAVVDEVHCLSEWGHDFRTSYLNLSNTISKFSPDSKYIGLTATASVNVLKDIQNEFGISPMDVKTPLNYTRKELSFNVIDDGLNKKLSIKETLDELNDDLDIFKSNGADSKCGIIFTATVNGDKGCYPLSQHLSRVFNTEVLYYSGSVPTIDKKAIMPDAQFDSFKRDVQDRFKNNDFTLLTATKAFGMGVNKGNIHYTIHYGLPASMESLYQEAGRAGRDKHKFADQKAQCIVLLSKEPPENDSMLQQLWDPKTILAEIKELSKKAKGDINTNLFMFSSSLDTIKDEFLLINKIYKAYCEGEQNCLSQVDSRKMGSNKAKVERVLYRLNQLGIIKDWTIENFYSGLFEVEIDTKHCDESVKRTLLNAIHKYEKDFTFEHYETEAESRYYTVLYKDPNKFSPIEKCILVLLIWSYDHFAYNRRQSLKNVYENCLSLSSKKINKDAFKQTLENYFKFNESSHLLQYIADSPYDYVKWFEIFYIDNNFIGQQKLIQVKDQLSRFLESYMQNPGLDMISGLIRLMLNDFENTDGSLRMSASIVKFKDNNKFNSDDILNKLLEIVRELDAPLKSQVSKVLLRYFKNIDFNRRLYEDLQDDYSLAVILDGYSKRLKNIYKGMESTWQT